MKTSLVVSGDEVEPHYLSEGAFEWSCDSVLPSEVRNFFPNTLTPDSVYWRTKSLRTKSLVVTIKIFACTCCVSQRALTARTRSRSRLASLAMSCYKYVSVQSMQTEVYRMLNHAVGTISNEFIWSASVVWCWCIQRTSFQAYRFAVLDSQACLLMVLRGPGPSISSTTFWMLPLAMRTWSDKMFVKPMLASQSARCPGNCLCCLHLRGAHIGRIIFL